MPDPVLDSIDNVLHDYSVSMDAMRWTPEPPVHIGPTYTDLTVSLQGFADAWRRANQQVGVAVKRFVEQLQRTTVTLQFVLDWSESEAEAKRRSAMHSAYRRRRRTR